MNTDLTDFQKDQTTQHMSKMMHFSTTFKRTSTRRTTQIQTYMKTNANESTPVKSERKLINL